MKTLKCISATYEATKVNTRKLVNICLESFGKPPAGKGPRKAPGRGSGAPGARKRHRKRRARAGKRESVSRIMTTIRKIGKIKEVGVYEKTDNDRRIDEVSDAWRDAEALLVTMKTGEVTTYQLVLRKVGTAWRICHKIEEEWRPILDCPFPMRLALVDAFPALLEAAREKKRLMLSGSAEAAARLRAMLEDKGPC